MSTPVAKAEVQTPLLLEDEAAAYLRIAPNTLRDWRLKGIGPVFSKMGRKPVYEIENLNKFVVANRRTSTSDAEAAAPQA